MSEIFKIGDWIEFPKGTKLYPHTYVLEAGRKNRVQITQVLTGDERYHFLADSKMINRAVRFSSSEISRLNISCVGPEASATYDRFYQSIREEIEALHPQMPVALYKWGAESNLVAHESVVKIDPPESKSAGKPLKKYQQMIAKSVWRCTQDIMVTVRVRNPAHIAAVERLYNALMQARNKIVGSPNYNIEHNKLFRQYDIDQKNITEPHDIDMLWCTIKAGTELTCTGKRTSYAKINGTSYVGKSMLHPFKAASGITLADGRQATALLLPYDQIEPFFEALDVPQEKLMALRDSETGKFFKEAALSWHNGEATGGLSMVDRVQDARKYDDLSKVKVSVLDWSGYYEGLDENEGRPDWMGAGNKVADLPPTFEVVVYDKRTKEVLETIDIQAWYAKVWKLRVLTVNHGSIVRKVFASIERKNELDQFTHLLVMRANPAPRKLYLLDDSDIAAFEGLIGQIGAKRTDMRRAKDEYAMAVAFRDPNLAFMARIGYSGSVPLVVLNLQTMQEEVAAQDG